MLVVTGNSVHNDFWTDFSMILPQAGQRLNWGKCEYEGRYPLWQSPLRCARPVQVAV